MSNPNRRLTYLVEPFEGEPGIVTCYKCIKLVEWPNLDQKIHPPLRIHFHNSESAQEANVECEIRASWDAVMASDRPEIVFAFAG